MLNFREKVNEIIKEKQESRNIFEMYATNILNKTLQYIREYANTKTLEPMEMLFAKDKNNRVYAKVYIDDRQDRSAEIFVDTQSKDEAITLLVLLEQKFREEGYELLPGTSVLTYECFSVIITF